MEKKRGYITFSGIGFLFMFCCITGYELAHKGNIVWSVSWTVKLLAGCLVPGTILGSLLCAMLLKLKHVAENKWKRSKSLWQLPKAGKLFWISWLCTALCWLPGYLAYYPGICAYDFTIQLGQITSHEYNEHHPLIHTLLMGFFIDMGNAVGNATLGLAMYTLFQMLLLAAVLAGGIALLRAKNVRNSALILLQVFCCFFPFHWYMSITATKDTMFTVFMVLQLLMLCGIVEKRGGTENEKSGKEDSAAADHKAPVMEGKAATIKWFGWWDLGYLIASVLMILFRNNGCYAMLVLAAFLLLAALFGKKERKLWLKLFGETFVAIVIGSVLLSAVFAWTGAQQGDRREMLSMPIQQLARCMVYHGGIGVVPEDDNTMGEADKALINEFILNEAYRDYRPDIADPVKRNTNTYVFVYKMKDFLTTYFRLLARYPGDYINSVLTVNAGFLYPFDESHAYINVNGRDTGLGYIQTRWLDAEISYAGIERDSKWEWLHDRMEVFADSNMHLKLPVLKYLLVPGTYLWFYLLLAAWLFIHKRYRLLLPLSLVLGYYITMVLGPTVQLRYLYPVMVALPFLLAWFLRGGQMKEQ